MNSKLNIDELIIIIAAKGLKPYPFNADFLKQNGIVPEDWELAKAPLHSKLEVQSQFKNNVMFTAQLNRIVVTELIRDKSCQEIIAPSIAQRFIEKLHKMIDYQALIINHKSHLSFGGDAEAVSRYLYQNLFAPADWQDYGTAPVQSAIDLKYTLEQGNLYLKIGQGAIKNAQNEKETVVIFSGNFEYGLTKETQAERVLELQQRLAVWQQDLDTCRDLIESKFVSLAVPSLAVTA